MIRRWRPYPKVDGRFIIGISCFIFKIYSLHCDYEYSELTLGDLAMATVPKSEGVCSLLVIVVLFLVYAFYTKNNSCFGDGKILFVI